MNPLSLEQIFGEGAVQNGSELIIQKNSLPLLSPLPENTASSLLVAIFLKLLENFQGELNFTDENGHPITFDNRDAYELIGGYIWGRYFDFRNTDIVARDEIIIQLYEPN
jgi:hypothetical protein